MKPSEDEDWSKQKALMASMKQSINQESDNEDDDDEEVQNMQWQILGIQSMSMTANCISLAQRNNSDFCFIVGPAPGSRRINIVGYHQLYEIENMLFVSNVHILIKLRGGKAVTIMLNGSV